MSETELKPCPFCGADCRFEMDDEAWQWVECNGCGMQSNHSASLMEDCKPILTAAWNTRVDLAAAPAQEARKPLARIDIIEWWRDDSELVDLDLGKLEDFTKAIRAVEAKHNIT